MPNIQLADNLRFLRKKYGLNQDDMTDILNISRQAYSNYERCERTPDLDTLVRLSQYFDVPIDDMILKNLRTCSPSFEGIRESVSPYNIYAKCEETDSSVYLSDEEMNFIINFRSLPEGTKQIVTGFLDDTRRKRLE